MAFKKTITTAYGVEITDAYHRVEAIRMEGKSSIVYHVRAYKDNSGVPFIAEQVIQSVYDIDGENPIAQAYAHLKTLPEFEDAVDC